MNVTKAIEITLGNEVNYITNINTQIIQAANRSELSVEVKIPVRIYGMVEMYYKNMGYIVEAKELNFDLNDDFYIIEIKWFTPNVDIHNTKKAAEVKKEPSYSSRQKGGLSQFFVVPDINKLEIYVEETLDVNYSAWDCVNTYDKEIRINIQDELDEDKIKKLEDDFDLIIDTDNVETIVFYEV